MLFKDFATDPSTSLAYDWYRIANPAQSGAPTLRLLLHSPAYDAANPANAPHLVQLVYVSAARHCTRRHDPSGGSDRSALPDGPEPSPTVDGILPPPRPCARLQEPYWQAPAVNKPPKVEEWVHHDIAAKSGSNREIDDTADAVRDPPGSLTCAGGPSAAHLPAQGAAQAAPHSPAGRCCGMRLELARLVGVCRRAAEPVPPAPFCSGWRLVDQRVRNRAEV